MLAPARSLRHWRSLALLAVGVATPATFRTQSPDELRLVRVSDHVYAFITPEIFGQYLNGNTTLIVGDSAALVVDAGHFPSVTRRMIAEIQRITTKPVRF